MAYACRDVQIDRREGRPQHDERRPAAEQPAGVHAGADVAYMTARRRRPDETSAQMMYTSIATRMIDQTG
jgi:hypothetical protein